MLNTILIPTIAAVAVFMLYVLILYFVGSKTKTGERLKRMLATGDGDAEASEKASILRIPCVPKGSLQQLQRCFPIYSPGPEWIWKPSAPKISCASIEVSNHSPNACVYYLFVSRVLSLVFLAIAVMIALQPKAGLLEYALAFAIAFIGLFGADVWIKNMQDKRKQVLQHSFPDALDLLLACVESGLALDGALLRVCRELGRAHPEITYELNRTRIELSLLNDRAQALNNLADRNGMLAFRTLVTSLLQSEKFGTSLTDTLRVMSEDYRTQRLVKAEEKAGRLPALMTIPLILFLLPALMLIILGPAGMGIFAAFHPK